MSTSTSPRHDADVRVPAPRAGGSSPAEPRASAARRWWGRSRLDVLVLAPLLLVTGLVHRIGMLGAPQRIDDEGTYVAQAWSVFHLGELTHYTYWYDHPPLGWLQIAAYAELTGAFERAPYAVAAGREAVLVAMLVSTALLWVLARRLGLPRWGAGVAVGLFALSPLAVQFHRTVFLDNIATPWLLLSLVLALSPRRQLVAFAGAGLAFAAAVLTKETYLLALPVLVWLLWRSSRGETRRYALAVSGALLVLGGLSYVVYAAIKGEVVPGPDRTSLLGGVFFQLGGRDSSGALLDSSSLAGATLSQWLQLDRVLPALALVATPLALLSWRLRPVAVGMLVLLAMLVRPGGYVPVPFVVQMLPFAVLLVAGVAVAGWERGAGALAALRRGGRSARLLLAAPLAAVVLLVGGAAAATAAPAWAGQLRGLLVAPLDEPVQQAQEWVEANVPVGSGRILTDDALWVDLVEAGYPREDVVWFYKPDTDPDVPSGWEEYGWVISTESTRTFTGSSTTTADAVEHSAPVATFGTGTTAVEVRRVLPVSADPDATAQARDERAATADRAALELSAGQAVDLAPDARSSLEAGGVDGRLLALLAGLGSVHDLEVAALPAVDGEAGAGTPVRTAVLASVDGTTGQQALDLLSPSLQAQLEPLRPAATVLPDGSLRLRLPLAG